MPRPIRAVYRIPYGAAFGAPRANGTRKHEGTDYHCPVGTPIYGTGDGGVVTHIGYNGDPWLGLGHNVSISYPGGRTTVDAHMQSRTPLAVGSKVGPNTVVGYVGLTGNAVNANPPGSHDHHVTRINGNLVDPEAYYGSSTSGGGSTPINTESDDDMRYIYSTNRGGALVGEMGYYPYTDAEYAQSAFDRFGGATVTDRAFDVARQDAINRGANNMAAIANIVVAKISTGLVVPPAQNVPTADQIAAAVVAALPDITAEVDVDEIAQAVRAAIIKD